MFFKPSLFLGRGDTVAVFQCLTQMVWPLGRTACIPMGNHMTRGSRGKPTARPQARFRRPQTDT